MLFVDGQERKIYQALIRRRASCAASEQGQRGLSCNKVPFSNDVIYFQEKTHNKHQQSVVSSATIYYAT